MRNLTRITGAAFALFALLAPVSVQASDESSLQQPQSAVTAPESNGVGAVLGQTVSEDVLATQRGGADLHINENNAKATVQDNVARNLTTGSNTISDSAFSNVTGIPMVVQNSGNNVIIQNSTILNLQMK